jgi:hypothetical protein
VDERDVEVALERLDHLRRLVLAQEPVVDEHTRQLVADRLVDEQRRDRGVDAAGERTEDALLADLGADPLDLLLDHGGGRPRRPRADDAVEEVLQHLLAVRRVHDLRVELDAVQVPLRGLEGGDRGRVGPAGDARALGRSGDGVAVAHPADLLLRQPGGERASDLQLGLAELARGALDAAAEVLRHQLHPVADAEHGDAELVDPGVDLWGLFRVHRRRPAAEDQRDGVLHRQLRCRGAVTDELGVDARLADTPGDQLRVLPAEIDDEHWAQVIRKSLRRGLRSGDRERQNLSADGSTVCNWAPPS